MRKFFKFLNIAISIADTIYIYTHDTSLKILDLSIDYNPATNKYICNVTYSNGDKYIIKSNGAFTKIN